MKAGSGLEKVHNTDTHRHTHGTLHWYFIHCLCWSVHLSDDLQISIRLPKNCYGTHVLSGHLLNHALSDLVFSSSIPTLILQ